MVMDKTRNGVVGQLAGQVTLIGTIVATCAAVIIGANAITGRLDRNYVKIEAVCLSQKALDANLRLHIALEGQVKNHRSALGPFPTIDC